MMASPKEFSDTNNNVWNADQYVATSSFVAKLGAPVVELLQPQRNERILDVGCGDGSLTLQLAEDYRSIVHGIDSDTSMIEKAQSRAVALEGRRKGRGKNECGKDNSSATAGEGQGAAGREQDTGLGDGVLMSVELRSAFDLNYEEEFDAVFSNAVFHWLKQDPERVVRGVAAALKPGGRFVAEFGGAGNIDTLVQMMDAVFAEMKAASASATIGAGCGSSGRADRDEKYEFDNPWYFPSAEEYKGVLEKAGFRVDYIELIPRPTPLTNGGVRGWLETMTNGITRKLTEQERADFVCRVTKKCEGTKLYDKEADAWTADYVRLRFRAVKI